MLKHIILPVLLALLVGCGACVHAPPPQTGFIVPQQAAGGLKAAPAPARPKTYHHKTEGGTIGIVEFTTGIDEESAAEFVANLEAVSQDAVGVVVLLDSPGGFVHSTRQMIRAIEASHVPVVCVVDGIAASGAMLFLQSCDIRAMTHRSSLMVHNASFQSPEGRQDEESLQEQLHSIRTTNDQIAWQYCHRFKMTQDECRDSYRDHDWWMTETEALKIGAVDLAVAGLSEMLSVLDQVHMEKAFAEKAARRFKAQETANPD